MRCWQHRDAARLHVHQDSNPQACSPCSFENTYVGQLMRACIACIRCSGVCGCAVTAD